jgi:hypothetical protein
MTKNQNQSTRELGGRWQEYQSWSLRSHCRRHLVIFHNRNGIPLLPLKDSAIATLERPHSWTDLRLMIDISDLMHVGSLCRRWLRAHSAKQVKKD